MNFDEAKAAIQDVSDFLIHARMLTEQPVRGEFGPTSAIAVPPNLNVAELGSGCGLYFLLRRSAQIAYIGKATKNNLHRELWGKLATPSQAAADQRLSYLRTYWSRDVRGEIANEIATGQLSVAALWIDPPEVSSLLEVYLQTRCFRLEGHLPVLNRRIG